MSNVLTFELRTGIFIRGMLGVVTKLKDKNGYKISWQSLEELTE